MSEIKQGRIIKGISGFYTVDCQGEQYICKARGKFRNQDVRPTVGDTVDFVQPQQTHEGYIAELHDRKNLLLRPSVANIDLIIIVIAAADPMPDLLLVDKMLINASMMKTDALICINKYDITGKKEAMHIAEQYPDMDTVVVSAQKKLGINEILKYCNGRIVCLGGQSGTGKTSLLNEIITERSLEVGEISKKTKRGKHTTRHAELIPFNGGYLVDTPGFSLLELPAINPYELKDYYQDFQTYEGGCRYKTCRHDGEPECLVVEAVQEGKIAKERYERYRALLKEADDKWRIRYD